MRTGAYSRAISICLFTIALREITAAAFGLRLNLKVLLQNTERS